MEESAVVYRLVTNQCKNQGDIADYLGISCEALSVSLGIKRCGGKVDPVPEEEISPGMWGGAYPDDSISRFLSLKYGQGGHLHLLLT